MKTQQATILASVKTCSAPEARRPLESTYQFQTHCLSQNPDRRRVKNGKGETNASDAHTPMALPTRALGRNRPQVTGVSLGLMSFAGWYGQRTSIDAAVAFLDRAHQLGERFWDTADVYTNSEAYIAEWFKPSGKRDDIFLATKFGGRLTSSGHIIDNDPAYVREACSRSLKTLGIDTIDLDHCHRVDSKTPIEHTIKAMAERKA